MKYSPSCGKGLPLLPFLLACAGLLEGRFGRRGNFLAAAGFLLGIGALQAGLLLSGQDKMLLLTLLPLTAYLPAVIGIHILSGAGFLPNCRRLDDGNAGFLYAYVFTKAVRSIFPKAGKHFPLAAQPYPDRMPAVHCRPAFTDSLPIFTQAVSRLCSA